MPVWLRQEIQEMLRPQLIETIAKAYAECGAGSRRVHAQQRCGIEATLCRNRHQTVSIHRLRDFIVIAILQLTRAMGVGMKRTMLAGVGAALMAIPAANAADLGRPVYKAPPPAVPAFSWTGCYIGGNIGGGWGRETASAPTLAPGISVTGDSSGVIGGGQVVATFNSHRTG